MALVIPTRQDRLHYEFETTLDGELYTFEFRWATREAAWFVSTFEEDGTPLAVNRKVVLGIPIAKRDGKNRPPGRMIAVDTSGQDIEAKSDDLGTRVLILYYEEGERLDG